MLYLRIVLNKMTECFDLIGVALNQCDNEQRLHLYLDENDIKPKKQPDATSNGFYEESRINDFPTREYRIVLHVRRRRWKDVGSKNVSKNRQLVAKSTYYSKGLATFLKEFLGYIPDYSQVAPETLSHKG